MGKLTHSSQKTLVLERFGEQIMFTCAARFYLMRSDITPKNAIDIAIKYGDLATKLLQFFVAASLGIGGWLIASPYLRDTPRFSESRMVWVAMYSMIGFFSWILAVNLHRRMNACLGLARGVSQSDESATSFVDTFASAVPMWPVMIFLPALILFVDCAILLFK